MQKTCSACKLSKPIEEFNKNSSRPDGLQNQCRSCHRKGVDNWQERNYDKLITYGKKWKAANPELCRKYARTSRLRSLYDLTEAEYEALAAKQKHRCAICRRKVKLVIDHCHKTGKVRGLLCVRCNSGLGALGDDGISLRRALQYVEASELESIK